MHALEYLSGTLSFAPEKCKQCLRAWLLHTNCRCWIYLPQQVLQVLEEEDQLQLETSQYVLHQITRQHLSILSHSAIEQVKYISYTESFGCRLILLVIPCQAMP